jgi:hypothetical protein
MIPRDSDRLDSELYEGLAPILADISDRHLGRMIGCDHKTATDRKSHNDAWRQRELGRLADSNDQVRRLLQARYADRDEPRTGDAERAAADTISDAGEVIAELMRSMADSQINPTEARQCLVKAMHLKSNLEQLISTLDSRVRGAGRGRR